MTFLHAAFLGGALAIAVPIVLHLVMRRQPKHLEFPALRFIKQREHSNRRTMNLRHWLLLALRCALVGLLALSLARPSIVASGMLGDQEAPVAAALVFDTNPRMQYRQDNQTRLQVAQDTALWLLAQLPRESDVAVVDSRTGSATFAVDIGAARQRVERLDAVSMSQPLGLAVENALELLSDSAKQRKEIYIFTDLAQAAWSREAMRELAARLNRATDVGVYVIDVGVKEPGNFGLGETRLSSQVLSQNSPLLIQTDLTHVGPGGERAIELYVEAQDGKPEIRGRQTLAVAAGQAQRADFQLRGLGEGVHQGYLKIVGEDALACDDTHYFSVQVRPAWRILIVAPNDAVRAAEEYALFLSEALSPYAMRVKGEAAFTCEVIAQHQLGDKPLAGYSAVCLVDPQPVAPAEWQKLHAFVTAGGGLGVFLGRNAVPVDSFNEPVAQELLPARLVRQWRAPDAVTLAPDNYQHPVLRKFRNLQPAWELVPVFRHWQLDDLAEGTTTVLAFSSNQPALVERPVGKGRVLLMTTPISDPASRPGERNYEPWNLLPTGDDRFVFFLLANTMAEYLVGSGAEQLNYTTGDTAIVRVGPEERSPVFVLTTPRGDQMRTPLDERRDSLAVAATDVPGNYRLQAGGGASAVQLGFSVNLPPSVSQLERVTPDDLAALFSDTPFRLARNRDEIDRSVSAGRVGQELFPYLIILLVVVLAAEQVVSNRFYQDYDTRKQTSRAAQLAAQQPAPRNAPARSAAR